MATTITASNQAALFLCAGVGSKRVNGVSSPVLGWVIRLPTMEKKGRVRCVSEGKPGGGEMGSNMMSMGTSLMAAAAAVGAFAGTAMALVDERLSTEGTGLPFGLSNNLLGWILFVVFGLIWALYFTYTSTLDEDEDSGLSL